MIYNRNPFLSIFLVTLSQIMIVLLSLTYHAPDKEQSHWYTNTFIQSTDTGNNYTFPENKRHSFNLYKLGHNLQVSLCATGLNRIKYERHNQFLHYNLPIVCYKFPIHAHTADL